MKSVFYTILFIEKIIFTGVFLWTKDPGDPKSLDPQHWFSTQTFLYLQQHVLKSILQVKCVFWFITKSAIPPKLNSEQKLEYSPERKSILNS